MPRSGPTHPISGAVDVAHVVVNEALGSSLRADCGTRPRRRVAMRYRAGAGARGMTHALYLTALVELHAKIRELADGGDAAARTALNELGLETVAV